MRDEYDFSKGKRGPAISSKGKTRITIYLDDEILESFRERAEARGMGYQTLINEVLKAHLENPPEQPLTESDLRRVLREELLITQKSNSKEETTQTRSPTMPQVSAPREAYPPSETSTSEQKEEQKED